MSTLAPPAGRIGPNAITRLAEAMPRRVGASVTREVFVRAGLVHHLLEPPQHMVDETEVRRLHGALRDTVGDSTSQSLAREAGTLTARYLLAHRIPRPVQSLLRILPARLAAQVLLVAIARHAWTFAGSGQFSHTVGGRAARTATLRIRHNPLCRDLRTEHPACAFYAATFEHLFAQLVHRNSRVNEVACEACGAEACEFEVCW
jgi:divinyl protochlorophyllide a 8-vinyl-reductase